MVVFSLAIKLLISPININEVKLVLEEPPDIVDIKNPLEGSLGANFPWVLERARNEIDSYNKQNSLKAPIELSAAIGDFPNLPGSASLAALGAATTKVNYVKIGLMGPASEQEAFFMAKKVVKSVKNYNNHIKVVIAGYGDSRQLGKSVDPLLIPKIAAAAAADVAMLDTAIKNGKSIFEHLTNHELEGFIDECSKHNIESALAGSLKFSDLEKINALNPTIIGVRSMVCENFDREKGHIKPELIAKIKANLT